MGYQIRFEADNAAARLLFVTEGVLLRQLESEPNLSQYDVVILDEVGVFACDYSGDDEDRYYLLPPCRCRCRCQTKHYL